jgi:hypothetical protein
MPPHLTELGCTFSTWSTLFALLPFVPHLRCIHLFHGHFNEGGIGLDPARLVHLPVLQLSNLEYATDTNVREKAAASATLPAATGAAHVFYPELVTPFPQLFPLAAVFAGLSSLRTLTLPCVPQIELLLAHVHLCPSLGLLQLQWVGLAKKCGVVPASLSHPTPASVLQLLQQAPSLRVHFVRAREWEWSDPIARRFSAARTVVTYCLFLLCSLPSSSVRAALLSSGHIAFLWSDPLHCLPPAGSSGAGNTA